MPPTHLTSVDLPAPLSPTRAVTSPLCAVKSTSRSTCTGPKLLLMPLSSSSGSVTVLPYDRSRRRVRGPGAGSWLVLRSADARGGALRGVRPRAQLVLGHVAVGDHVLDVVLVDRHRRLEVGLDVLARLRVLDGAVHGPALALGQRHGQPRGRVGLLLDGLVDGHALGAVEDVLQTLHGRVLAGHRYLAGEVVL